MHGIIFNELKTYVDTKFGGDTWNKLLEAAGLGKKVYMPIQEYPDAEAAAIVGAASQASGKEAGVILEDFGEFIAPDLIKLYRHNVKPDWKTLDLIENTEQTIHKVVRLRNPGARPPELRVERPTPSEVVIFYTSPRKMCGVAKGIARGLGKHYGENIEVSEKRCMHRGDELCEISVRQRPGPSSSRTPTPR